MSRRTRDSYTDESPFDRRTQQAPVTGQQPYGSYTPHPGQQQYPSQYARRTPAYGMTEQQPERRMSPQPQPEYADQVHPQENRTPRRERRAEKRAPRKRRMSLTARILMLIGLITVIVLFIRRLIVPLLVYLNTLGGGAV